MASFTSADTRDANRSTNSRYILHRLNVAACLNPQIVSHMVVEIFPANPTVDYRFNERFADHAILVTIGWHSSGRGCINSSCYPTYPKGKMCDLTTPTAVFMSGNRNFIEACQPACFMRQRQHELLKRATRYADRSLFTDNADPKRCVECDHLNKLVTDHVLRRRVDGGYDLWDSSTGQKVTPPYPPGFHIREAQVSAQDHQPDTKSDMPFLGWNAKENRCELRNVMLHRFITEPYWRDHSHSACRLTNFTQGENVVPGYFSRDARLNDADVRAANLEGFLMKNTATYCRAFNKIWDPETGECDNTWWEKALLYTILGDGVLRLIRNTVEGTSGCVDDYFKPTADEIGRDPKTGELDLNPLLARTLRQWRGDVNLEFTLPPPNVTLLDLGIDPLVTGNRLYWNNFEGVLSHLAFFKSVEIAVGGRGDGSSSSSSSSSSNFADWRSVYGNYNDKSSKNSSGVWGELGRENSSVRVQPDAVSALSEYFVGIMNRMDDNGDGDAGGGGGGSAAGSTFTAEDAKKLVDHINSEMDKNSLLEMLKEMGITFGAELMRHRITNLLKKQLKKLLQYSVRTLGGRVAGALMRVGLRVGMSRTLGFLASQLTTKLIIASSSAATGIGVVISAIELLSMAVDIALLCGWDPGNYRAYTSAESFRPLMDGYFYTLVNENAVSFTPDSVVSILLLATVDNTDLDKNSANGGGTADAKPTDSNRNEPAFSDENAIDLRVTVKRWYNARWSDCYNNEQPTKVDPRNAPSTRRELRIGRMSLENDENLWSQLNVFFYLGSLETNSYGQLVNLEEQTSEFDDATLADIMQEADYRDLTTISTSRSVDNRAYNSRVRTTRNVGAALIGIGSALSIAIALTTLFEPNRRIGAFLTMLVLMAMTVLIIVWVCCWPYNVIDTRYRKIDLPRAGGGGSSGVNADDAPPADPDKPVSSDLKKRVAASVRAATLSNVIETVSSLGNLM